MALIGVWGEWFGTRNIYMYFYWHLWVTAFFSWGFFGRRLDGQWAYLL